MIKVIAVSLLGVILFVVTMFLSQHTSPFSGFYTFRRLYEKTQLAILTDPQKKSDYYRYLLLERRKEIALVYNSKDYDLMLASALRFSTTAGEQTNYILAHHLTSEKTKTIQDFAQHQNVLKEIIHAHPIKEKQWLEDAHNYLDTYTKQLKSS